MNVNELITSYEREAYDEAYEAVRETHPEWSECDADVIADVIAEGWEGEDVYRLIGIYGQRVIWAESVADLAENAKRSLMRVLPGLVD